MNTFLFQLTVPILIYVAGFQGFLLFPEWINRILFDVQYIRLIQLWNVVPCRMSSRATPTVWVMALNPTFFSGVNTIHLIEALYLHPSYLCQKKKKKKCYDFSLMTIASETIFKLCWGFQQSECMSQHRLLIRWIKIYLQSFPASDFLAVLSPAYLQTAHALWETEMP